MHVRVQFAAAKHAPLASDSVLPRVAHTRARAPTPASRVTRVLIHGVISAVNKISLKVPGVAVSQHAVVRCRVAGAVKRVCREMAEMKNETIPENNIRQPEMENPLHWYLPLSLK